MTTNYEIIPYKPKAIMPSFATAGSAGVDLCACLDEPVRIAPNSTAIIGTGLNMKFGAEAEVQIRSRSGLAAKHSVAVLNSPGTIDSDYCGEGDAFEIKVILHNHGKNDFVVNHGDRIAQAVLCPLFAKNPEWSIPVKDQTRIGGLGSTGTS